MSHLWIVLDTKSDRSFPRVGHVTDSDEIAASAGELTVAWPDGSQERVKLSAAFRKFRLDTLSALAEFAPDQLAEELATSPMPFARALAEKPKVRLRSKELLAIVRERGALDRPAVDKAWKTQRAAFEAMVEVHVDQTGSEAKYQLVRPLPVVKLPLSPVDRGQTQPSPQVAAALVSVETQLLADKNVTDQPLSEPTSEDGAISISESAESEQSKLTDIAKLLSMRNSPGIDPEILETWLDSPAPGVAIAEGAKNVERLRDQPDAHAERLASYSLLVSRILKRPGLHIPPEALAMAFVALQRSAAESERRRGIEALERAAVALTNASEFLSRIDRSAFQAALAKLPLVADGVRARILVAIARSNKMVVADAGWWRGFSWSDVSAVANGALSRVISDDQKLTAMVRDATDTFAREIGTRQSLAKLLGAPRFALEHLTPELVCSIFDSVAQNDNLFARWQAAVSDTHEKDELARRVLEAEERALRASAAHAAALTDLEELSAQLERVQRQLGELQAQFAGLSDRERRQMQIDSARVVAQVAATVDGDGRNLDHETLVRKVSVLLERIGLHTDARHGESVAFDPRRHHAPGLRPEEGEMVNVARAGYSFENGEERVVVLPALVTRTSGSKEARP